MAKSFLGSFLTATAKAVDKAIKQATKERERQIKLAEKERLQPSKKLDKLRNYSITVNGQTYYRNLLDNPVTDAELSESKRRLEEVRT